MRKIDYFKKQPIVEITLVIQGEGKLSGIPHFLVRTTGCTMRCCWGETPCDSWYTSHSPEKGSFTLMQLEDAMRDNPQIKHLFVTGGSPTMHQELLKDIDSMCKSRDIIQTLETEGSDTADVEYDLLSLSPKLQSSIPIPGKFIPVLGKSLTEKDKERHEKHRCNYEAMRTMIKRSKDYQVKFVYSSAQDMVEINQIVKELGIPNNKVYLMPMGMTDDELQKVRQELFTTCIATGMNYTDRLHIIAYGDRRNV